MPIDVEGVKRIAAMARLSFSDDEMDRFVGEFQEILAFVEQLSEAGAEEIEPLCSGCIEPWERAWREDRPFPSLPRREALRNAPDVEEGHFRVPLAIE